MISIETNKTFWIRVDVRYRVVSNLQTSTAHLIVQVCGRRSGGSRLGIVYRCSDPIIQIPPHNNLPSSLKLFQ